MSRSIDDLFGADGWSPLKVQFWLQPFHWTALGEGLGADEAEGLRYEWTLVKAGQRDILGRPCLCSVVKDFPAAVRGGRGGHHDSLATLVGLRVDLEQAADSLPLPWRATERIFAEQRRDEVHRARLARYHRGLVVRLRDRDPEPVDPDTGRFLGRQLALASMAWFLGWRNERSTCRWPRRPVVQPSTSLPKTTAPTRSPDLGLLFNKAA